MTKLSRPAVWLAAALAVTMLLWPQRGAADFGDDLRERWILDPREMIGDPDNPVGGPQRYWLDQLAMFRLPWSPVIIRARFGEARSKPEVKRLVVGFHD